MNMLYRGATWTKWQPNRATIAYHLTEAWKASYLARERMRAGNRYMSLQYRKAARYQLELARRERLGMYGVYGEHYSSY